MRRLMVFIIFFFFFVKGDAQTYIWVAYQGSHVYAKHIVVKGETLFRIANEYHSNVDMIKKENNLMNVSLLQVGKKLLIPLNIKLIQWMPQNNMRPLAIEIEAGKSMDTIVRGIRFVSTNALLKMNPQIGNEVRKETTLVVGYYPYKTIDTTKAIAHSIDTNVDDNVMQEIIHYSHLLDTASMQMSNEYSEGYFKNNYNKDMISHKTIDMIASIFKTTNGWDTKKYYALTSIAPPGSIVKVSSQNGKSIYAKVLGPLPSGVGDTTIGIRISDAGSNALALKEVLRFHVWVSY